MSTEINDGGPAFPRPATKDASGLIIRESQKGMTLRDYFAGQALSSRAVMLKNGVMYASDVATECYDLADAMLAAKEANT
jgi:hypothetical protein